MREWYNWTTFDVIGDLGFGSAFGCLDGSAYHPWVRLITHTIREDSIFRAAMYLGFKPIFQQLFRWGLMNSNIENMDLVKNKLQQRMKLDVERPDFIEGLIKRKDEWVSRPTLNHRTVKRTTANSKTFSTWVLTN